MRGAWRDETSEWWSGNRRTSEPIGHSYDSFVHLLQRSCAPNSECGARSVDCDPVPAQMWQR